MVLQQNYKHRGLERLGPLPALFLCHPFFLTAFLFQMDTVQRYKPHKDKYTEDQKVITEVQSCKRLPLFFITDCGLNAQVS